MQLQSRSALFALGGAALSVAHLVVGCIDSDSPTPSFDAGPIEGITIEAGAIDAGADADKTAPETTLSETPPALTNQKTARFAFTADRPSTFACKVDANAPQPCTSPLSTDVAEGEHTFSVSAISNAGTPDPTPATFSWKVDLTPPVTTITSTPPALDNSKTVTFEFSATETSTFECKMDSGASTSCTSPFQVGALGDGAHVFSVVATDQAGNAEAKPATYSWTIDTSVPDTQIDTGPSGTVATKNASFTFSSPNAGAGATFQCAIDGAAFAACTSPRALANLAEGSHTFQVKAKDAVGNVDPSPAARTWIVDTVPPTVTITGGPNGLTNAAKPTFTFTATGATKTECRIDAAAFALCNASFTPAAALADGAHTFQVRASDGAVPANTSTASRAFTVDTSPPSVQVTSGPSSTALAQETFTFNSEAGSTTSCRIYAAGSPSGSYTPCTSPDTENMPSSYPALSANWTYEVLAVDAAGNPATATWDFSTYIIP